MRKRPIRAAAVVATVTLFSIQASAQWTQSALSTARVTGASTTVGDKAIVAGGRISGGFTDSVEIYTPTSGTWSQGQPLSIARSFLTATTVGSKAMFAGGMNPTPLSRVDIYDNSTGQWSTANLSLARYGVVSTTVGSKAIFAGGSRAGTPVDVVDIFDNATGSWTTAKLSIARRALTATTVGSKAMFAGGSIRLFGYIHYGYTTVDIYDESTGTWTTDNLSVPRGYLTSTTIGSKALFAGGHSYGNYVQGIYNMPDSVDVYDDLTGLWTTLPALGRRFLTSTTVGSKAIFWGGIDPGYNLIDLVEIYDASTGLWATSTRSNPRQGMFATTVGSQALFIGGGNAGPGMAFSSVVDIYTEPKTFTTYCTAKKTLVCGAANISATGCPSATDDNGFVIKAQPVRGCRAGFLLYSNQSIVTGVPFGGPGDGVLCLFGSGLKRAGPIQTGSLPHLCEATFAIDMNRFNTNNWAASGCNPPPGQNNPAGFLGNMGTTVNAQMWGRDSIATGQVLSDVISWSIGP